MWLYFKADVLTGFLLPETLVPRLNVKICTRFKRIATYSTPNVLAYCVGFCCYHHIGNFLDFYIYPGLSFRSFPFVHFIKLKL